MDMSKSSYWKADDLRADRNSALQSVSVAEADGVEVAGDVDDALNKTAYNWKTPSTSQNHVVMNKFSSAKLR